MNPPEARWRRMVDWLAANLTLTLGTVFVFFFAPRLLGAAQSRSWILAAALLLLLIVVVQGMRGARRHLRR